MNNLWKNQNHGYWIAVCSAAILSTTAIFIRYLSRAYALPPLVLAFWRDLFVSVTLLIVFLLTKPHRLKVKRNNILIMALYGLTLAFFNALWTTSVAINGAAVSTVLVYSSTGFTAILGRWLLKEHLNWIKIIAVFLSLGGCVLISGALNLHEWKSNSLGIFTGLFSGFVYAIYSLMGRTTASRGMSTWTTTLYIFGFAAFFLLLSNLLLGQLLPGAAIKGTDLFWLGNSIKGWGILLALAAGPTLLGFGLYNTSLTLLPASVANLIVSLEPAFTALIAYFALAERLSSIQILGSLMILGGVIFLKISEDHL